MKRFKNFIGYVARVFVGIVLYIISPKFRRMINAKLKGSDDPVATKENVVVVMNGENKQ